MQMPFVVLFLNLGTGEILLIVMFVVMFFGTGKLPEIARTLGKGIRQMKNATAEIQREIEIGSTEIQRDINISDEISELKKATEKITGGIKEGLNSIESHHNSKEGLNVSKEKETIENENPLVPPGAVKRD